MLNCGVIDQKSRLGDFLLKCYSFMIMVLTFRRSRCFLVRVLFCDLAGDFEDQGDILKIGRPFFIFSPTPFYLRARTYNSKKKPSSTRSRKDQDQFQFPALFYFLSITPPTQLNDNTFLIKIYTITPPYTPSNTHTLLYSLAPL